MSVRTDDSASTGDTMNADLHLNVPAEPSLNKSPDAVGAIAKERLAPRTVFWRTVGKSIERGGLAAAAIMGGLTFSGLHMFGLIPDTLIGAVLVGLLASAIIGLTGLAWKLLGLFVHGVGRLGGRLPWHGSRRAGERVVRAAAFLRRVRGDVWGALLAPFLLVFIDQTGLPGATSLKLMAPGELLVPFILLDATLIGTARAGAVTGFIAPRVRWLLAGAALVVTLAPVSWLLDRGYDDYLFRPDPAAVAALAPLTIDNPALPGSYRVERLSYGSGQDRHRREYGPGAAIITPSVDAHAAWSGFGGMADSFYKWWYGFDSSALPLNGLVWRPVSAEGSAAGGPFPLVLIAHGNHTAGDYSDLGYAYLCEHLASRGFIAVSVDENFLNGWFFYDGEGKEMPVRAWLLLKHLQQWRQWNADPANTFYGQVDLDRIALMGHSRGGEAAAHAAAMNTKFYTPIDKVARPGEFGFGIRAVVGIAPPDGQYRPGGRAETLEDVSYLALYGGHDQDLWWAAPLQQYNRVEFAADPRAFKAVAYVYRANHGQFNTVWADADRGEINSLMLNRRPLLNGEEQRTAGKVFITSFLAAALQGRDEYREVFQAPDRARAWLPEDVVVTQYEDATFQAVNTNQRLTREDGIDATGRSRSSGLTAARRTSLVLRNGDNQGNNAMLLEWAAAGAPTYTLDLAVGQDATIALDPAQSLTFTLATGLNDATPVGVTVELRDAAGVRVALPLADFGPVHPPLEAHLLKSPWLSRLLGADYFDKMRSPYERVLQTYVLPLAAFAQRESRLDVTGIAAIQFRFDGARDGKVYLDQVGFSD